MENPTPISLTVGPYELSAIPTGIFGLDGGSMFGTVPKILWEKQIPADENNRIPMEARGLLLKGEDHTVLIDTGNGGDFVAKYGEKLGNSFAKMYNVDGSGPSLMKSLERANTKPEDITHVILTHLHFDHAGGGVTEKDGQLVPTFPNATYYVQQQNLETAKTPNLRERASYLPANWEPLIKHNKLQFLDGPTEILPHISVTISNGHTKGQQVVKIQDNNTTVIYCADLIATSAHIRLPWVMGYDLEPLTIIEEKKELLSSLPENSYLFFEHDPYCDLASFESYKGSDFIAKERFCLK